MNFIALREIEHICLLISLRSNNPRKKPKYIRMKELVILRLSVTQLPCADQYNPIDLTDMTFNCNQFIRKHRNDLGSLYQLRLYIRFISKQSYFALDRTQFISPSGAQNVVSICPRQMISSNNFVRLGNDHIHQGQQGSAGMETKTRKKDNLLFICSYNQYFLFNVFHICSLP